MSNQNTNELLLRVDWDKVQNFNIDVQEGTDKESVVVTITVYQDNKNSNFNTKKEIFNLLNNNLDTIAQRGKEINEAIEETFLEIFKKTEKEYS